MKNVLADFKQIKTFIFDVDGVFTNSELIITEEGELLRKMHTRDGYAVKLALNAGIDVIIITGGSSIGVVKRLKGLGVKRVYYGIKKKLEVYNSLVRNEVVDPETTAYMGDDLPDFCVMKEVKIACCPSDAATEILEMSDYVSPKKGGEGAVRDVLEKTLRMQSKWPDLHSES